MPGETVYKMLANNWKFWGPKGLFMTHAAFEFGVAFLIRPMKFNKHLFKTYDLTLITKENLGDWYRDIAKNIYDMDLYHRFYSKGWDRRLAKDIKHHMLPQIVNCVALVWYGALKAANEDIEV